MIEGVKAIPLKRIPDERGTIYHMLRKDEPHFIQFGEIYFSSIHPNVVKGWHKHKLATLNYACIVGNIKLIIYDDREKSKTKNELVELFIGEDNYCLVQIPPDVWNGFKAVGSKTAIIANCCTHAHGDFKSERLDPFDNDIPYDWDVKHR
ncbi:MAG: hypothetical protein DDT42_01307 [candidate division WS2 bacterium]|uniref:dTDP-4-dehydrorhamnose 3,5-epimerase n=1 Tax=Psychracetigena formicireducens TaxID=2986056 RepID=A0A9E2F4U2_PSYF1|nr:hypothetical protein [Candidatus Psychracetigena formicireducens]MBT9145436.1 hypothetical protein [Candidatus Psychracetigena formicireducens]